MPKICISYEINGKENDHVQLMKDELESHEIQICDTNSLETKYDNMDSCDIFIAFMIGNSPNAMYDAGYAMSQK